MKERPILFQGAMVRALLAGAKTQTRRALKPQPVVPDGASIRLYDESAAHMTSRRCWQVEHPGEYDGHNVIGRRDDDGRQLNLGRMPFCVGDRLWVKETWRTAKSLDAESPTDIAEKCLDAGYSTPWAPLAYEADGYRNGAWRGFELRGDTETGKTRVSIHMPRWASRIKLEVTGVRVERLWAISEQDAIAEGIEAMRCPDCHLAAYGLPGWGHDELNPTAMGAYRFLWESLNGAGSWVANPWVWVVEFRRVQPALAGDAGILEGWNRTTSGAIGQP